MHYVIVLHERILVSVRDLTVVLLNRVLRTHVTLVRVFVLLVYELPDTVSVSELSSLSQTLGS
jgi:hypothetical protein